MLRVLNYANRLLFILAIAAVVISIIFTFLWALFGAGSKRIFFPLIFAPTFFETYLILAVVLFFIIGIAYLFIATTSFFYTQSTKIKLDSSYGAKAVLLMIFPCILPIVTAVVLLLLPGSFRSPFGYWKAISTTSHENTHYHLAYYTPDSTEGMFNYYLYACDKFDLFCEEIYQESAFTISTLIGNFEVDMATLHSDPAAHTVTLAINGKAVYVHEVK